MGTEPRGSAAVMFSVEILNATSDTTRHNEMRAEEDLDYSNL